MNNRTIPKLFPVVGLLLGAGVTSFFLSSNWELYNKWWYWAIFFLDVSFCISFIIQMKSLLRQIYVVKPHFEVITKKGAKLYGEEIRVVGDGNTVLVINQEAQQYLRVDSIRFVDDVSELGTRRMTWGQFVINKNKE